MMHSVGEEITRARHPVPILPEDEASGDVFSPLELRDRVVIMAIFYEIVGQEQVKRAWHQWKRMQREGATDALWMVLVKDPAVDSDAIYGVAAQIYGFEEAGINMERAQDLIRDVHASFSRKHWQHMVELLVAPIAVGQDPRTGQARLIFATHDPTRPTVTRFLQSLQLDSFELRYAAPSKLIDLFTGVFGPEIKARLVAFHNTQEETILDVGEGGDGAGIEMMSGSTSRLNHNSLVDWFESVLIATYQERASEVRLFVNPNHELEIHFGIDGLFALWHKENTMHPEGVLAYIMDKVIKVEYYDPDVPMEVRFERWINSDLTRFHLRIQPADDSKELRAATVIIRVLGHRETSKKGMGPWKAH